MVCEKCWGDAHLMSQGNLKEQGENYRILLEKRKDNPCTPDEQSGKYQDKE